MSSEKTVKFKTRQKNVGITWPPPLSKMCRRP